jgi:hypothetical protein
MRKSDKQKNIELANKKLLRESTEGKYDLTNQGNVDDMMRDVISILTKYVGTHSTNNASVGNDNRVIIYNMIKSGEFQKKISQMLPPSSLHKKFNHETNQPEIWTDNPEEMTKFLASIGVTNFNLSK